MRARLIAAAVAALLATAVFLLDSLLYGIRENAPSYYSFSTYVEYRRALGDDLVGTLALLGYASLAGSAAAGAVALLRRAWLPALAGAGLACGAIVLPALVPSVLPRSEYGVAEVFHVSSGATFDLDTGKPKACFAYGVEGEDRGGSKGELCLTLRNNTAGRRVVTDPGSLSEEHASLYDFQERLNESGIRPFQIPEPFTIDGAEVVAATWSGHGAPVAEEPGPGDLRALGPRRAPRTKRAKDAQAKRDVRTLQRYLAACYRQYETYVGCDSPEHPERIQTGVPRSAAELSELSQQTFRITAHSLSGVAFTLRREPGGRMSRVCVPEGVGTCPATGRW